MARTDIKTRPEIIHQLIDNLATAVVLLDDQLNVVYLNAAAEALFEISANQVLQHNMAHLFPHDETWLAALRRSLSAVQATTEREIEVHLPVSLKLTKIDCTVTRNADTNLAYSLLLEIRQIDHLLRIAREEVLLSQQNAMKTLVRGFAHEVKNPLGGLRGAAQLLERELTSEDLKEYTRIIIDEADRLQDLVNHMLGPNRPMRLAPTNIHEVLERVRQLIEAENPSGLDIVRDYDPSIPDVTADKDKLIQAVLNIAQNAVQALQGHGTITLRSRAVRQCTIGQQRHRLAVRLDIIDNGPGILPELKEQIFFPMVTGRAEGTGLGLTIAQTLIGQHSGLIECNSEPGCTQFTILLPLSVTTEREHRNDV